MSDLVATPPGPLRQVWVVLEKDLLIEWRARSRGFALASFAVTVLLLFSFAVGPDIQTLREHAGAYLWLAVLLSSTLLLGQSFQLEEEAGALEGLILAPIEPASLFYGKALANTIQLVMLALVITVPMIALFDGEFKEPIGLYLVVVVLGAAGVSAPGTLYAGLTARLRARQLLLPLLLFPLLVPCLLASVKATGVLLEGDVMDQYGSWVKLLAAFDVLYWAIGGALFSRVVDA
jgi:heme exporter protein B